MINSDGKSMNNATLLLLPDLPKDKNPRGLYDEEKQVFEELFALHQHVETRFVENFSREKKSEAKSNARRFSSGRLVTAAENYENNLWLQGELALHGRPIGAREQEAGAPTCLLPKQAELLLPESGSANSDLRLSDRPRPSPEQTAAQKGVERIKTLLDACIRGVSVPGPVLLVNLTGYVEETGTAVGLPSIFSITYNKQDRLRFRGPGFWGFRVLSLRRLPCGFEDRWVAKACKASTTRSCTICRCTASTRKFIGHTPTHG